MVGLVAKPVTGVVDIVQKTSQGMEVSMSYEQQCPFKFNRLRNPLVFYGDDRITRDYVELDAHCF